MAFAQGFEEGHDGVVEENDDYGKTKADGRGGALLLHTQGRAYDGKDEAGHGEREASIDFHEDAGGIGMGRHVCLLCEDEFADGHFIQLFIGVRDFRGSHGVRDILSLEAHHPFYAGLGQIVNGAIGHGPYAIVPHGLRRIFYMNDFFVFKFLDRDIFQYLRIGIIAAGVEEVCNFPILHIADDHMVCDAGVHIFLDFRIDYVLVFPVGPGHYVFIESHSADADEERHRKDGKRQAEEALAGGTHDDKLASTGETREAHEGAQEDSHWKCVHHDARQGQDENLHCRHRRGTVLGHVACDFEERISTEEDRCKGCHTK